MQTLVCVQANLSVSGSLDVYRIVPTMCIN